MNGFKGIPVGASRLEMTQKLLSETKIPAISIIVPTLREAPNIPILALKISDAIRSFIPSWELIVVDDHSRDGIVEICRGLQRRGMPVRLVVRKNAKGLATAVLRGFENARAPVFVVMDADLSHSPIYIPELYRQIQKGADFVIGSRYIHGGGTDDAWTVYRYVNSKIATLLSMPLISVSDPMSGFFALSRSLWEACGQPAPLGYKIGIELIVRGRPKKLKEIPIHFESRKIGESKLSIKQQWLYLCHLARLYGYRLKKKV